MNNKRKKNSSYKKAKKQRHTITYTKTSLNIIKNFLEAGKKAFAFLVIREYFALRSNTRRFLYTWLFSITVAC
jgi:hypothetical protein